jgi:hypothetical protein
MRFVVLLRKIVKKLDRFDCANIVPAVIAGQESLHASPSSRPKIMAKSVQFYCFGACGFAGVVVVGCGRVADGAEGTAGAATPEEAL